MQPEQGRYYFEITTKAAQMRDGERDGYCEWVRKNGVRMRSGHFGMGKQSGEWITTDARDEVHEVTRMK